MTPEQGFQNFLAPDLAIFLLWLRLRLLLIKLLLAPAPLRTKICYKSLTFVNRKNISITAKPKNYLFILQDNIKNHYFLQNF